MSERVRDGRAVVTYSVLGCWLVEVRAHELLPWDGPEELRVSFATDAESAESDVALADQTNGITTEVLRAVPLVDARKRLRRLRAKSRARRLAGSREIPRRLETNQDWAAFAAAYADAVAAGNRQPLVHLSAELGVGRNTLSARVRRLRALGLLTRPDGDSLGELTPAAKALLKGNEQRGKRN